MTNEEIGILTIQYNQTIKELNRSIYRIREEMRHLRNERNYWIAKREMLGQYELFPTDPNPTKN